MMPEACGDVMTGTDMDGKVRSRADLFSEKERFEVNLSRERPMSADTENTTNKGCVFSFISGKRRAH